MKELSDFEMIALLKEIQPLCPNCGKPLHREIQTPPVESIGSWRQFPQGCRLWCESCSFDHFIEFTSLPRLSDVNEINAHYDKIKEEKQRQFEEDLQDLQLRLYNQIVKIDVEREVILQAATGNNGKGTGCRITFQDNVLYCAKHDNFLENLATAKEALEMLLGFEVTSDQITVERYRSVG